LLPPSSVDLIFLCDVIHHLEDRPAYYQLVSRALKRDGRVVVVDFRKPALPIGPPPEMKLNEDSVIREFREAGFTLNRNETFLPYQYFLEFTRLPVESRP
jgi:SAM-dependent methyltransferase